MCEKIGSARLLDHLGIDRLKQWNHNKIDLYFKPLLVELEFVKEQWGLIAAPDVDEEFDIKERVEVLNTIVNTSLSFKYLKAELFHTLAAGLAQKIVEKLRSKWAALVGNPLIPTIEADISQGAQLLESIAALLSQCNAITDECVSNERAGGKAESEAVAQRAADIMNSFRKHDARIRMLAAVEDPMHACEELEGYASAHGKDDFYEKNCPLSWQAVALLLLL